MLMAIVLAGCGSLLLGRCSSGRGVTPASARGSARDLAFPLVDGGAWRLRDERGHVVALNFWATWCGPCRSETPSLAHLNADLAAQGFRVIGISLDAASDREVRVRSFRQAYHVNYPMAFPEAMSQIASGLEGIPTTLLFDRKGRVAKVYVGELEERTLRVDALQLLREP